MNSSSSSPQLPRREFLKTTAAAAAATAVGPALLDTAVAAEAPAKMVGIQAGPVSFVDEGVDAVLDIFQEKGAVNTLFLTTFTYGHGLSGRQIRGEPFPDHGKQESDDAFFHGGNYATPHAEFYQDTPLKDTRAPDHPGLDIVATVLPAARRRGMKFFCSIEDAWRADVPGMADLTEVDLQGNRTTTTLCPLHPGVHAFWTGLATDLCKSYDIDGVLFFNENNGPLLESIGASHNQRIAAARATCFCEYHKKAAQERGISFDRAHEGFVKLNEFVQNSLQDKRPSDGYFVEFFRLLVNYPEIIAWDRLFDEGKHSVLGGIQAAVKGVRPNLQVGFHIEHVNSFNPIFRATRSYAELAAKADLLKIVVYNNCAGERYANFIRNIHSTVFRDVPMEELMRFNNHLLNYRDDEPGMDALAQAGMSADTVFRETQRALAGAQNRCKILPGIDIDIPTGTRSRKALPEDTKAATTAGLKAGADGVLYSRKYSEMRLANLAAAGQAVREFKGL